MADVTQYIGARYVPVFADPAEWTRTKQYEPLTIVLHEGNSYTSRQAVPVGVDISNERFWLETGNYNAQVEQYRNETLSFVDAVAGLAHDVEQLTGTLNIYNSNLNGTNILLECDGTYIAFDCGLDTEKSQIQSYLYQHLGSNKLSALIISHFHSDHAGAPDVYSEFCDSSTKVYVQMAPSTANGEYASYTQHLNSVKAYFPTLIIPYEGQTVTYGKFKLTFHNVTDAHKTIYDSTQANNAVFPPNNKSGLNNYSLITLVETPFGSYGYTGDIEGVAQELNAKYMKHVDVLHYPHHISNWNGYEQFFIAASPLLLEFDTDARASGAIFNSTALSRYWVYSLLRHNNFPCVSTSSDGLHITLRNGDIYSNTPITYYNHADTVEPLAFSAISSAYYDRNPYSLYDCTIRKFMDVITSYGLPAKYNITSSTKIGPYTEVRDRLGAASTVVRCINSPSTVEFYYATLGITPSLKINNDYEMEDRVGDVLLVNHIYKYTKLIGETVPEYTPTGSEAMLFNSASRLYINYGGQLIMLFPSSPAPNNRNFIGMRESNAGDGIFVGKYVNNTFSLSFRRYNDMSTAVERSFHEVGCI